MDPSSCPGWRVIPSHTINHQQPDRSPAPRPPRQPASCQLTVLFQTRLMPRSIIHRHFGNKVPLLSIMGHMLDAKWSFVESAKRVQVFHLAWLETSSRAWTATSLNPIIIKTWLASCLACSAHPFSYICHDTWVPRLVVSEVPTRWQHPPLACQSSAVALQLPSSPVG